MKYKHVFIYGLPRTRSKFYQKLLNEYYDAGVIHETHLITHRSAPYLGRWFLSRLGLMSSKRVEKFLIRKAVGGFWRANKHEYSAATLDLSEFGKNTGGDISPSGILSRIFAAVEQAHSPRFVGARHFASPIAIRYIDSRFEQAGHVILTRSFADILKSKTEWELRRGLGRASVLVAFCKLTPLWIMTSLAVVAFGCQKNTLVLHHARGEAADRPLRDLLDFLGLEYVAGYSEEVGVVDSSFDGATGQPF